MRLCLLAILLISPPLIAAPPTVVDPDLVLELVAEAPEIVTPTGIAVDAKGRIWCIENQTHQRQASYQGPPTDRVRVFEDFDARGRAGNVWTFAEGFRNSMGLTFGKDGAIYLATRANIYRLGAQEGKETRRTVVMTLETKGDYPHNGLSGFAWDGNGDLIFGLGENLGESYKLIGSDGTTLTGGGEGGSVYRCRGDGSNLSRVATGFWNPFAQCVDSRGDLFIVDNDPDARGPCRLVHVIQGGDYGYRFRYGRKGLHPFQAWNGELPGTLPMAAGTSEAPSGIIACDYTALPAKYAGQLLITSWGDHTIEAFELSPRGASYSAKSKIVVRGDENFRPVSFAIAPDGSVVFSDWVDKSYPVHGKGRIWRLRARSPGSKPKASAPPVPSAGTEAQWIEIARSTRSPSDRMKAILHLCSPDLTREFIPTLADPDPFLVGAALAVLGRPGNGGMLLQASTASPQPELRLGLLLALRRTGDAEARKAVPAFLGDADPAIRRAAIQWVAEEKLAAYAGLLEQAVTKAPVTRELFEAWLAAGELLSGRKPGEVAEEQVAVIVRDVKRPAALRTLAVRTLRPDHPALGPQLLSDLFRDGGPEMRGAVVRAAMLRADAGSQALLRRVAADQSQPSELRALAVTGLANSADTAETRAVLERARAESGLKLDAERSLGRAKPESPRSLREWRELLAAGQGDAQAGERVFFHAKGPSCYKCHRIESRGANVGPDLTFIGRAMTREKLVESILEPSKEIAPAYTSWKVLTRDGRERVGLITGETFDSFVTMVDSAGKPEKIRRTDIEERTALRQSIMPDELPNRMTRREFLDLLAFLQQRK